MINLTDLSRKLFAAMGQGREAPLTDEERQLVGSLDDQLRDKAWLSKELHHLERFDGDAAYRKVTTSPDGHPRAHRVVLWSLAAVALLLLGFTWWRGSYSPVPPAIDAQTAQAIHRMKQAGSQEATLTADGQTLSVSHLDDIHSYQGQQRLHTPADKEFWVTLDDGTRVHLNNNSTLSYPSSFGSGDRRVELDGEAYFMVATDTRRPFIVATPEGEVRDYGTQFNVNTQEKQVTTVVLVEGAVGVTPTHGTEQHMKPDQMATLSGGKVTIADTDVTPYVAWNTGTFLFHDCTLEDLLKVISKWHGVTITCDRSVAHDIRLSGALDRYSSFGDLCHSLETITGHKVVKRGANRYVLQ